MSINTKEQIKCPACGALQEMTVWQSITAADSADLKEDLKRGRVNIFRCTECGQTALLPTPMLYTDGERNLMISFSPCNGREERMRLFESVKAASRESGELRELEDYNLRFTSEYNELLEKILIFDNDMDDKTIEVLKLLVLMQESEKMEQRVCMFGKTDGDMIEFMVQDKKEEQVYTSRVPMETYRTVKQQLRESGVKDKSFDWEMVDAQYAASLLYGANNNL
ncbi:MAG: CpXC domain-containing protein [Clostridia bacterium]|nr:CpXC domain-containing protein [Clostridia bacterium]